MKYLENRPDSLGIFPGSQIEKLTSSFDQSRYADAVQRLVLRLQSAQTSVGERARGKRRKKVGPAQRSNTIRSYLKALEKWSYYCIGTWGYELDPRQVDSKITVQYAMWLKGDAPGPDIRAMLVRGVGEDFFNLYTAVEKAVSLYGQVTIYQIIEQLDLETRNKYVRIPQDASDLTYLRDVHKMLGFLVRNYRTIFRDPPIRALRESTGEVWGDYERNPLNYTYFLLPKTPCSSSTVAANIACLSAVWSELTARTSEEQAPLSFNPWKSTYAAWSRRSKKEKEEAFLRGETKILTTPIVLSLINACVGDSLECRRDMFAIKLLAFLGLRAEELASLLRKDMINVDGVLNIAVVGKGDSIRRLPLFSELRDAFMLLDASIRSYISDNESSSDEELSYGVRYCRALLEEDAPLVPSLIRWGCNMRKNDLGDRMPERDAMEPIDVSGVRAMLWRIADRAVVKEVASGKFRVLTKCNPECKTKPCSHEYRKVHPHAFRHYAATAAQSAGLSIVDVQDILGHKDIRTTRGYIQVPANKSMAFSAGVMRTLNKQAAFTTEEVQAMQAKVSSPLDDPTIEEAIPSDLAPSVMQTPPGTTGFKGLDTISVVQSPIWAYEAEEKSQYLPMVRNKKVDYIGYSSELSQIRIDLTRQLDDAISLKSFDTAELLRAKIYDVNARMKWNNFRIGKLSRLPWWAGTRNTWKGAMMAPIPSYFQLCPEDEEQGMFVYQLKKQYDHILETQGPTSAMAMAMWIKELSNVACFQFSRNMAEQGHQWVKFTDPANAGDKTVVREHDDDAVLDWLSIYGTTLKATKSKSAYNRGNIAIIALESLPDWYWLKDPLLDLGGDERTNLKNWILSLQGKRQSKIRYEQWLEEYSIRLNKIIKNIKITEAAGKDYRTSPSAGSQSIRNKISSANAAFAKRFPSLGKVIDIEKMKNMSEEEIKNLIRNMLRSENAGPENLSRSMMGPAIEGRAGYDHPYDPKLLTFDLRSTIVHTEEIKKYWFEKYGSDSECVVRRAVRALWEERKSGLRSSEKFLLLWDTELSSLIPCPKEMEDRMRQSGWKMPQTPEEILKSFKILYEGLLDLQRVRIGASRATDLPLEEMKQFWGTKDDEIQSIVIRWESGVPTVVDTTGSIEQILKDYKLEAVQTAQRLGPSLETFPPPSSDVALLKALRFLGTGIFPKEFQTSQAKMIYPNIEQESINIWIRLALEHIEQQEKGVIPPINFLDRVIEREFYEVIKDKSFNESQLVLWLRTLEQEEYDWIRRVQLWIGGRIEDKNISDLMTACLTSDDPRLSKLAVLLINNEDPSPALEELAREKDRELGGERYKMGYDLIRSFGSNLADLTENNFEKSKIAAKEITSKSYFKDYDLSDPILPQGPPYSFIAMPQDMFRMIAYGPNEIIIFASGPSGSAYKTDFLRKLLKDFPKAEFVFDHTQGALVLIIGKKALRFAGIDALEVKKATFKISVPLPFGGYQPNWFDEKPWQFKWPNYPDIDPTDSDEAYIRELPWPEDGDDNITRNFMRSCCMKRYSRWKRNGSEPDVVSSPVASIHPIDFILLSLKNA